MTDRYPFALKPYPFAVDPEGPVVNACEDCGTSAQDTHVVTTADPYAASAFDVEELVAVCKFCYQSRCEDAENA